MKFVCYQCSSILTRELIHKQVEVCEEDGADLIPKGITLQDKDWSNERWIINSEDNLAMDRIDIPSRLNGCCDLDGCDGPNLVCRSCKAEVATARYDCWMPRHIIMSKEVVIVMS